jgi:hypothetical protein
MHRCDASGAACGSDLLDINDYAGNTFSPIRSVLLERFRGLALSAISFKALQQGVAEAMALEPVTI